MFEVDPFESKVFFELFSADFLAAPHRDHEAAHSLLLNKTDAFSKIQERVEKSLRESLAAPNTAPMDMLTIFLSKSADRIDHRDARVRDADICEPFLGFFRKGSEENTLSQHRLSGFWKDVRRLHSDQPSAKTAYAFSAP